MTTSATPCRRFHWSFLSVQNAWLIMAERYPRRVKSPASQLVATRTYPLRHPTCRMRRRPAMRLQAAALRRAAAAPTPARRGLGRVSLTSVSFRLASILQILARSRRGPCRNSQSQANPAHGAGTSSRKSRSDLRGRPQRPAPQSSPHRRPPRFGRSSKVRFPLAPDAHRHSQDTRHKDATRHCRSNLLHLLEPRRSLLEPHQTRWPTMLISFS